MMKKGFYIHRIFSKDKNLEWYGVYKKIVSQCDVLASAFDLKLETINIYGVQVENLWSKIKRRLPYTPITVKWEYNSDYSNADFIYIRKTEIDFSFIRFLQKIKKHNEKCKIIFEIPTYPYDKEIYSSLKDIGQLPFLLKDILNRRLLKKYVDRIVIYTTEPEVFGVKTINLLNGIDFEKVPLRAVSTYKEDSINIIMVAYFAFWHGYDRLLKGLGEYYKNGGSENIVLHFVGKGEAITEYKKIVNDYSLQEHVLFYGWKSGSELDKIYDKADIAVDILGGHRKDYRLSSSLKSREYCAKGLPFITECEMDFLLPSCPYVLTVPFDDSNIDINNLVSFYKSLYEKKTPVQLAKEIRNYAYNHCDMHITMKPVVDFLMNDNS